MNTRSHVVLITGGASGIGGALAERFLKAGNEVIVCGRRGDKLREFQSTHPGVRTRVCDVEDESQRDALVEWAVEAHPGLDVLVNNAGIQCRLRLVNGGVQWKDARQEIEINFAAPIHLCMLFLRHLQNQQRPAIVNVTSGLAFVPLAVAPIYCATKAALHSFTLSLRRQLSDTPIEVIEIAPPAVNTDLGGPGLHTRAMPLDEFADAAFAQLAAGAQEVTYGFSERSSRASRQELDEIFARMNQA